MSACTATPNPPYSRAAKPRPGIARRIVDRIHLEWRRYEVTIPVYHMAPFEQFVVNASVIAVLALIGWLSLLSISSVLYGVCNLLIWVLTVRKGIAANAGDIVEMFEAIPSTTPVRTNAPLPT
jgi:membrane protein required for beta-lactamase induction